MVNVHAAGSGTPPSSSNADCVDVKLGAFQVLPPSEDNVSAPPDTGWSATYQDVDAPGLSAVTSNQYVVPAVRNGLLTEFASTDPGAFGTPVRGIESSTVPGFPDASAAILIA